MSAYIHTDSRARKTILFPTDFSATSRNAFTYALDMASHIGARILLFHAYYESPVLAHRVPEDFVDRLRADKEARALAQLKEYEVEALRYPDAKVEVIPMVEPGRAYEGILETAAGEEVSIIIMGTRGSASLAEHIRGSLTTRIIEGANCPVLAVPEEVSFQPIQHILYASNFEEADFGTLDKLLEYAELFEATVSCAHVYTDAHDGSPLDREFFERIYELERSIEQLKFFSFHHKDVVAGIQRFITANKVDLISMLTHKRETAQEALADSLTRVMTLQADVPLLAFHCE